MDRLVSRLALGAWLALAAACGPAALDPTAAPEAPAARADGPADGLHRVGSQALRAGRGVPRGLRQLRRRELARPSC